MWNLRYHSCILWYYIVAIFSLLISKADRSHCMLSTCPNLNTFPVTCEVLKEVGHFIGNYSYLKYFDCFPPYYQGRLMRGHAEIKGAKWFVTIVQGCFTMLECNKLGKWSRCFLSVWYDSNTSRHQKKLLAVKFWQGNMYWNLYNLRAAAVDFKTWIKIVFQAASF